MKFYLTILILTLQLQICRAQQEPDSVNHDARLRDLDTTRFKQLTMSADTLVLVNFSADWCIVCKKEKPILDQLRSRHPEIKLLEVDMEQNPLIAAHFEVDGLPVNLLYKNGQMVWNRMGMQKLEDFETVLWQYRIKKTKK